MFSQRGFSLLDLTIVTLVIGLVLAGAGTLISRAFLDMDVNQALADMEQINRSMRAMYPHTATVNFPSFQTAPDFDTSVLPDTVAPFVKVGSMYFEMGGLTYRYFSASHAWTESAATGDLIIELGPGYFEPPVFNYNALVFRYRNVPLDACFALVLRSAPDAWRVRFEVGGVWLDIVTPTARQVDSSLVRAACANYTRFNIEFIKVRDDVY